MPQRSALTPAADKLLLILLTQRSNISDARKGDEYNTEIAELLAADLVTRDAEGLRVSATGRAYLARRWATKSGDEEEELDPFRAQHLDAVCRMTIGPEGPMAVRVNDAESPLMWLARRKSRDGSPLVSPTQLQAGERLRADFTRAQLTPRVTADWTAAGGGRRSGGAQGLSLTDMVVAARQRIRQALAAVGPEFSGLLLDVCCFLKRLDDVERERQWPARSAKVVLQLGLDRLARHYGFETEVTGPRTAAIRTWLAADADFVIDST